MNVYALFAILAAALAIVAMVTVAQSGMSPTQKILWFILVVILPIVGPAIYYFMKLR